MTGRFSRLAMTMAMLAVLLRALIPAGFMVAPASAPGQSRIVICSGQGAVEVVVDADGHRIKAPPGHEKGSSGEHPCAFASVATANLTADTLMVASPAVYADPAFAVPTSAQRPGLGLAAPPPPKTGPPLSI